MKTNDAASSARTSRATPTTQLPEFYEFPQPTCEKCGATIGKHELRDDVCDECAEGEDVSIEGGAFGNSDASTDLSKMDLTCGNTHAVHPPSDLDSHLSPAEFCCDDSQADGTREAA